MAKIEIFVSYVRNFRSGARVPARCKRRKHQIYLSKKMAKKGLHQTFFFQVAKKRPHIALWSPQWSSPPRPTTSCSIALRFLSKPQTPNLGFAIAPRIAPNPNPKPLYDVWRRGGLDHCGINIDFLSTKIDSWKTTSACMYPSMVVRYAE